MTFGLYRGTVVNLVTYASSDMSRSQQICIASALRHGAAKSWEYHDVAPAFREKNASIFSQPRGAGYWLWKPYVVDHVLGQIPDGELLVYVDSGVEVLEDLSPLVDLLSRDLLLFSSGYLHRQWCKGDVLRRFSLEWPACEMEGKEQVQASVLLLRASAGSRDFVAKWLQICQEPGMIDDSPSVTPNAPDFREHRHDQAILSCLAHAHGLELHWWPDATHRGIRNRYGDAYPVMFNRHRRRNWEW